MKKLLITGFEPFGGESINPSWQAVLRLPNVVGEYELTKLCIPVVFGKATKKVIELANEISPDTIVCIGQAGGRYAITPELVGINLRHATIPDNAGNQPIDKPIIENGAKAFFSTIPVREIAERIKNAGILSQVSYSAGAYVCNDLLYGLLSYFENKKTAVGFIHVPYCNEQNKQPSLSLDDIVKALTVAIETM